MKTAAVGVRNPIRVRRTKKRNRDLLARDKVDRVPIVVTGDLEGSLNGAADANTRGRRPTRCNIRHFVVPSPIRTMQQPGPFSLLIDQTGQAVIPCSRPS